MQSAEGYAGNVSVTETYEVLSKTQDSALIDVRTQAEWAFVGVPDLGPIGKDVVLAEWQSFPSSGPNPGFPEILSELLAKKGLDQSASLYFLCRSGARSQSAAIAMTEAGFPRCYNVSDGFEGPLDGAAHRGTTAGWKVSGLPWIQK